MSEMMSVRCAWCGRSMGEKMGPAGKTSDGICHACSQIETYLLNRNVRLPADVREALFSYVRAYKADPIAATLLILTAYFLGLAEGMECHSPSLPEVVNGISASNPSIRLVEEDGILVQTPAGEKGKNDG